MRKARTRPPYSSPAPDQVLQNGVLQVEQLTGKASEVVTMVSVTLAVEVAACTLAGPLLSHGVWLTSAWQGWRPGTGEEEV